MTDDPVRNLNLPSSDPAPSRETFELSQKSKILSNTQTNPRILINKELLSQSTCYVSSSAHDLHALDTALCQICQLVAAFFLFSLRAGCIAARTIWVTNAGIIDVLL